MTAICTTKQFGDGCEHLVLAHLLLAGIPASKMPDGWPGYDLIAQPDRDGRPARISVKGRHLDNRTYWTRFEPEGWDWLAIVGVVEAAKPRFWIIPREAALAASTAIGGGLRRLPNTALDTTLAAYEDNLTAVVAGH